ncbi:MAG: hypothetical protein JSS11_06195 [Verrucomicrobia bacterium]|nr:hypothetical protein [Verrucomicrobiota bacterium]
MPALEKIILRLERWQTKNRKAEAVFFAASWLMFSLLRVLNHATFGFNIFETLLSIGLYIWYIVFTIWCVLFLTPYLGAYLRRRRAGESVEQAMQFETRRTFTGSVWIDALVFVLVGATAFCVVGYLIYQIGK